MSNVLDLGKFRVYRKLGLNNEWKRKRMLADYLQANSKAVFTEASQLGLKEGTNEYNAFISKRCQELAKDWVAKFIPKDFEIPISES